MGIFSTAESDSKNGAGTPLSNGEAGAVAAASQQVKSTRGGARAGAGRKPAGNDGKVVGSPAPGNQKQNQAPVSEADIEFVKTIAESALKILDRVETNIIIGTIQSIGDPSVSERAAAYLKQREIGPGDVEIVVNAAGALAAKYSILSRYAPEAALLSWGAIHAMAFTAVHSDLKKLAIAIKAVKAKGVKSETDLPRTT